jgi:hypothetical protein
VHANEKLATHTRVFDTCNTTVVALMYMQSHNVTRKDVRPVLVLHL